MTPSKRALRDKAWKTHNGLSPSQLESLQNPKQDDYLYNHINNLQGYCESSVVWKRGSINYTTLLEEVNCFSPRMVRMIFFSLQTSIFIYVNCSNLTSFTYLMLMVRMHFRFHFLKQDPTFPNK